MASEMGVPFLGKIPLDPSLGRAAEEGRSILNEHSASQPALREIIRELRRAVGDPADVKHHENGTAAKPMGKDDMDPLLGSRIHLGF